MDSPPVNSFDSVKLIKLLLVVIELNRYFFLFQIVFCNGIICSKRISFNVNNYSTIFR